MMMQAHAVRFGPGTDLVPALLQQVVAKTNCSTSSDTTPPSPPTTAACIVTAVGSLSYVRLRMASATSAATATAASLLSSSPNDKNDNYNNNKEDSAGNTTTTTTTTATTTKTAEYLTLNECVEVVSLVGTISDNGTSKHWHMSVSRRDGSVVGGHVMEGIVYTTMEIVWATLPGISFSRVYDAATGYQELHVQQYQPLAQLSAAQVRKEKNHNEDNKDNKDAAANTTSDNHHDCTNDTDLGNPPKRPKRQHPEHKS